jgi:DNA processing protein
MFELLANLSFFDSEISIDDFASPERCEFRIETSSPELVSLAQADLDWLSSRGGGVLYPGHLDYPNRLLSLSEPPLCLTYLGDISCLHFEGAGVLGVVGSRVPTQNAVSWMNLELTELLRKDRPIVVSGGARGVDEIAENLSVANGLKTVVFLPSGLRYPYPENVEHRILSWQKGATSKKPICWISSFSLNTTIRKYHFENRNRLIVRLSDMILIPEARRRSGTTMTGRLGFELGVTVSVVPNSPLVSKALGGLDLLANGAVVCRDAQDLSAILELSRAQNLT